MTKLAPTRGATHYLKVPQNQYTPYGPSTKPGSPHMPLLTPQIYCALEKERGKSKRTQTKNGAKHKAYSMNVSIWRTTTLFPDKMGTNPFLGTFKRMPFPLYSPTRHRTWELVHSFYFLFFFTPLLLFRPSPSRSPTLFKKDNTKKKKNTPKGGRQRETQNGSKRHQKIDKRRWERPQRESEQTNKIPQRTGGGTRQTQRNTGYRRPWERSCFCASHPRTERRCLFFHTFSYYLTFFFFHFPFCPRSGRPKPRERPQRSRGPLSENLGTRKQTTKLSSASQISKSPQRDPSLLRG